MERKYKEKYDICPNLPVYKKEVRPITETSLWIYNVDELKNYLVEKSKRK